MRLHLLETVQLRIFCTYSYIHLSFHIPVYTFATNQAFFDGHWMSSLQVFGSKLLLEIS